MSFEGIHGSRPTYLWGIPPLTHVSECVTGGVRGLARQQNGYTLPWRMQSDSVSVHSTLRSHLRLSPSPFLLQNHQHLCYHHWNVLDTVSSWAFSHAVICLDCSSCLSRTSGFCYKLSWWGQSQYLALSSPLTYFTLLQSTYYHLTYYILTLSFPSHRI